MARARARARARAHEVVREGSRRFDDLEPPRTSALEPCKSCFPCKNVDREGSVQSNHPELLWKNSTYLSYLCDDVVREVSRRFDALEPPRTSA